MPLYVLTIEKDRTASLCVPGKEEDPFWTLDFFGLDLSKSQVIAKATLDLAKRGEEVHEVSLRSMVDFGRTQTLGIRTRPIDS